MKKENEFKKGNVSLMSIGAGQLILIILAILILFGAGKLPNVMADLAKGLKAFKKGMAEEEDSEAKAAPLEAPKDA